MSTGWIMKPNLLLHVATVRPDPAASPGVELTLSMAMSVSASKTFMTIIATNTYAMCGARASRRRQVVERIWGHRAMVREPCRRMR